MKDGETLNNHMRFVFDTPISVMIRALKNGNVYIEIEAAKSKAANLKQDKTSFSVMQSACYASEAID